MDGYKGSADNALDILTIRLICGQKMGNQLHF